MRALTAGMILGALTLAGCGQGGGAGAASGPSKTDPVVQKLLADLPATYAAADLANGRAKFQQCRTCHTVVEGGPNMTGPNLNGVFGRAAASKADYSYSADMKASGLTWDAATLDKWITQPRALVANTKMSFAGLKDANDRRDVIAYLKVASSGGPS